MSRMKITDDDQDRLFGIFDSAQDLQRRVVRMIARGFYNEHSLQELHWKVDGIMKELGDLTVDAQVIEAAPADKTRSGLAEGESPVTK